MSRAAASRICALRSRTKRNIGPAGHSRKTIATVRVTVDIAIIYDLIPCLLLSSQVLLGPGFGLAGHTDWPTAEGADADAWRHATDER